MNSIPKSLSRCFHYFHCFTPESCCEVSCGSNEEIIRSELHYRPIARRIMWVKTEVTRMQSKPHFPKNERFLPPDTHTYVYVSGGKKRSFFGKLGVLCILVTSVLRFALLPYYRRKVVSSLHKFIHSFQYRVDSLWLW